MLEAIEGCVEEADMEWGHTQKAREQLADLRALLSLLHSEKPYLGGEIGRLVRKLNGEAG